MENIIEIIQSLGFPIACVVALSFFLYKIYNNQVEENKKREERLYGQLDKFSDSLNSFNETLIKIDTRLSIIEEYYLEDKKKV